MAGVVGGVTGKAGRSWPFVGREAELAHVGKALELRETAGLVVAGPPGVGKSRLAAECAASAERTGMRCARVVATPVSAALPLGALGPLLPAGTARTELRADMFRAAADAVVGGDDPLLLVVDDAHLLDEASAAVVHQLVWSQRCFVVLTMRTGMAAPGPMTALWTSGALERIDIGPFDRVASDRLLGAVLDGPIDGACCRDIWEASRGNALYLRELVLGALDAGVLRCENGLWRLTRSPARTPRLVELVEARLADLEPADRDILDLLAIGEPLWLDTLGHDTWLARLVGLERKGLVATSDVDGRVRVRLAHPLHGEVLRESMTALGRVAVNRRLADLAAATTGQPNDRSGEDVLRAAVWRLDGGGAVDRDRMLQAARQAFFAHDDVLAERLARAARSTSDDGKDGGVDAGLLLAQVAGAQGRHEERQLLLAELAGRATSDEEYAMLVMDRAYALFWGLGRVAESHQELDTAMSRLPAGPWRDELTAQRAVNTLLQGDVTGAIALSRTVLAEHSEGRAFVKACIAAAPALGVAGRCEEAVGVAERGLVAHLALGHQEVMSEPTIHVVAQAVALGQAGRLAEADGILRAGYELSVNQRARGGQAWCALQRGCVALVTGQLELGEHLFTEGAEVYADLGFPGQHRWCVAGRLLSATQRGDPVSAARAVAELDTADPGAVRMMEPDVIRARAWYAWLVGDIPQAHELLESAVELAESTGAHALTVAAWHDLARLGWAAEAAEPLRLLATVVEGELADVRAMHASGLAGHDVERLEEVADRFEGLGALLFAAEAASGAAAAYRRRNQSRLADKLAIRAQHLADRCPGAATPALRSAGRAARLTPRERHVAHLAARGLSSKAIAAHLTVSVRTVDSHLQRIYMKLGVAARMELTDALRDR